MSHSPSGLRAGLTHLTGLPLLYLVRFRMPWIFFWEELGVVFRDVVLALRDAFSW